MNEVAWTPKTTSTATVAPQNSVDSTLSMSTRRNVNSNLLLCCAIYIKLSRSYTYIYDRVCYYLNARFHLIYVWVPMSANHGCRFHGTRMLACFHNVVVAWHVLLLSLESRVSG